MVTGMFLAAAWGLNPISEGGFALWPRGVSPTDFRAEEGFIILSGSGVEIPGAVSLRATPTLELGAGLQTYWGGNRAHIPYLPLGVKYQTDRATALNLDFWVPTQNGNGGLRLGALTRLQHGGRLSSVLSGQIGFFDAFTGGGGAALGTAWTPSLRLLRGVSLQCGLVASSDTRAFNDHFAFDLQPGAFVDLGRGSSLLSQITLGLAGPHREDVRAELALSEGF